MIAVVLGGGIADEEDIDVEEVSAEVLRRGAALIPAASARHAAPPTTT